MCILYIYNFCVVELNISNDEIWCSRKPKPQDVKATEDLLNIIKLEGIQKQLLDKKTPKYKVWEKIALKLQEDHGYVVSKSLKDSGMKCHQKWRNLEKAYMAFIQNSKKTGTGKTKTPAYFDLLHSILGSKHKVKPAILLDTLEIDNSVFNETIVEKPLSIEQMPIEKKKILSDDEDINNETSSHFKKIKTSTKPKDLKKELIDEIRLQHQEEMALQQKLIQIFEKSVEEQKEQRLILNNALLAIVETIKKQ